MSNDLELAYLAGIVDGEGCIRIKRTNALKHLTGRVSPGFHAIIQVRMVDEASIQLLAETLGGWYRKEKPHNAKGRPLFCWQITDAAAEKAIKELLPFLRIKKSQAECVLDLRELQSRSQEYRIKETGERDFTNRFGTVQKVKNMALSDEYIAMCNALCERCSELKRS